MTNHREEQRNAGRIHGVHDATSGEDGDDAEDEEHHAGHEQVDAHPGEVVLEV